MDHEQFEQLKPEEQEEVFHKIPFKEKGELLLHSHDPAHLAQSLSQEELYLVTREMDLEERSEVLRYASLPQLFFISDIDCWRKDRLDPKGFLKWLETLKEADEERLLAWLVSMDYETVVTGFQGLVRVLKPEWEHPADELLGDEHYFTLDERYFIFVKEENIEIVRRAIEVLFEKHRGRYVTILEGILGELDYEVEEEAYQNRTRRLADRGFPDPETAHHVYRPISRVEYERFPRKSTVPRDPTAREAGALPHYLMLRGERLFFDEVLVLFREERPEIREGLEEELAWLSNKVIAGEGIDFASEEKVCSGVERARRLVSLGLEDLSGRDLPRAREVLKERWLELIFRWGISKILELGDRAQGVAQSHWGGSRKALLEFLEGPYEPIFRGLFQAVPACYDPSISDTVGRLRDFKSLEDLERTRQAILQIEKIHELISNRGLNFSSPLFSLLGTLFAGFVAHGRNSVEALSEKELSRFLKTGFEDSGTRRVIARASKEKFLKQFSGKEADGILLPLWGLVFERLEDELSGLDPDQGVDPRFVTVVRKKT